jgi:hypothetical protein
MNYEAPLAKESFTAYSTIHADLFFAASIDEVENSSRRQGEREGSNDANHQRDQMCAL